MSELAKTEHAGIQAFSTDEMMLGFEGIETTDLAFPSLHLYQGTMQEEQKYPDAKRGDWLDASSGKKVTVPVMFVAVTKYASAFWSDGAAGGQGLCGSWQGWNGVPADVESNPEIVVTRGYLLTFYIEGEAFPFIFRAKRTAMKMAKQLISSEYSRAKAGKLPGVYNLRSRVEKNPAGQPYLVPVWEPTGATVTDDQMRKIIELRRIVASTAGVAVEKPAAAAHAAPEPGSVEADEIPF